MVHLVHITSENLVKRIRRSGIAATRLRRFAAQHPEHDRVVWAFPVLESYTLTHAWSRELKRWGRTALAAVTFHLPDEEPVYARHYQREPSLLAAAVAVRTIRAQTDPRGYEIMVPRRIRPAEIVRIRALPRAIGWRYFPQAKGRPPWTCDCPICTPRGEVNARRDRERVAKRLRELDELFASSQRRKEGLAPDAPDRG